MHTRTYDRVYACTRAPSISTPIRMLQQHMQKLARPSMCMRVHVHAHGFTHVRACACAQYPMGMRERVHTAAARPHADSRHVRNSSIPQPARPHTDAYTHADTCTLALAHIVTFPSACACAYKQLECMQACADTCASQHIAYHRQRARACTRPQPRCTDAHAYQQARHFLCIPNRMRSAFPVAFACTCTHAEYAHRQRAHAYAYAFTFTGTHARKCTQAYHHAYVCERSAHTYHYARTRRRANTHTHAPTCAHMRPHAHACIHAHAQRALRPARIRIRIRIACEASRIRIACTRAQAYPLPSA